MNTRIFGTLGPACCSRDILLGMLRNGMTGVRLNLSHTGLWDVSGWLSEWQASVEEYSAAVGISKDCFDLLCDMQGPEMRIGKFKGRISFKEGDEIELPVQERVVPLLKRGQQIKLDDGKFHAELTEIRQSSCSARFRVFDDGVITSSKSIKIEEIKNDLPVLTPHDLKNIQAASRLGVTGVMQPFVRGSEDIIAVRRALRDAGAGHIKIYSKIENQTGVRNISEIADVSDWIVIARGDLGNDMPLWELPQVQRRIAGVCRGIDVPFIVVTQMLESMIHSPVPTRAEISDIDHAIMDGASGVMVTGETAVGKHPVEVIYYLTNTVRAASRT